MDGLNESYRYYREGAEKIDAANTLRSPIMLERGDPTNTFSHFPTRCYRLIVDPGCLMFLQGVGYQPVLDFVSDLRALPDPVEIQIVIPAYLIKSDDQQFVGPLKQIGIMLGQPPKERSFRLDPMMPKDTAATLSKNGTERCQVSDLLALADSIQADGIVTCSTILEDARYPLYQHHLIRVVPANELGDLVEIIGHGHSVFWSVGNPERRLTFDVYYHQTHWKASRYSTWAHAILPTVASRELQDNLRSALLNRFPYLLYARDMVRFYELQRDHFTRRGLMGRFGLAIGYHVNSFYLLLWGMLDQMTVIAKYKKGLAVDERKCGIRKSEFWKCCHESGLQGIVRNGKLGQWVDLMADMRHRAAHSVIPVPTELLMDTEDSTRSNEDIQRILQQEHEILYRLVPSAIVKLIEPQMIYQWRIKHMKRLAPSMVVIPKKDGKGGYMRDPVLSIDYDLQYTMAIMDAFLVCLFGQARSVGLTNPEDSKVPT